MKRAMFVVGLVALLSLGFAAPVFAAAPGNDTYGSRTVIGSIPFSESIDTTEATTDADDTKRTNAARRPSKQVSGTS